MTEECITPLRRRMIEDTSVRHFASVDRRTRRPMRISVVSSCT